MVDFEYSFDELFPFILQRFCLTIQNNERKQVRFVQRRACLGPYNPIVHVFRRYARSSRSVHSWMVNRSLFVIDAVFKYIFYYLH